MICVIIYFVCGFITASLNFIWKQKQLDEEYFYFKEEYLFNFIFFLLFPFILWIFILIDLWMILLNKIVNVIKEIRQEEI